MPSILLYSDEPILAQGLKAVLSGIPNFQLCGAASSVEGLRESLATLKPDILLLDLKADVNFSMISSLHQNDLDTKIILWVHSIQTELALQAMSVGVRGVLRRTLPVDTMIRSLTRVHEGELWFEKTLTDSIMSARRFRLTPREGQLVSLLSQGLKNKEVAATLGISEGSVKVYLSRLFQKLGVKDRFELALYGLKNLTPGGGAMEGAQGGKTPLQAPRSFFVERIPAQSKRLEPLAIAR